MLVTLEEMKTYLRVNFDYDDTLLTHFIDSAMKLCMDIVRMEDEAVFSAERNAKIVVMYAAAYLYEHREEADHHALTITLRSLLFGTRQEVF